MCMEGAAGKNPVYHIGKVYHLFAHKLANQIYEKFGIENSISIVSQSGRDIDDPWILSLESGSSLSDDTQREIEECIIKGVRNIKDITKEILDFKFPIA